VAIINETMAHYYFGNANPMGKKIGTDAVPDTEIVGVVKDAKYVDLREEKLRHFYVPMAQEARLFDLTLHVRTVANPLRVSDMIRAAVQRVDPHLPLYNMKTLAAQVAESLTRERLLAWLTIMFGLLATLMAALGLYGVIAFSVARHTREIGIRIAMGAQTEDVLRLVLKQLAVLVSAGVVLGLGCALALSRLLASMLYEIKPADPVSYVAATLILGGAAALSAYLPARRATRVDPMTALRYE
jgi:ABC-type lipoprotein release transport system permease subunit